MGLVRSKDLFKFIEKRWDIYAKKELQLLPKPWTKDEILQSYRFCNVHREHDTETVWFKNNWRVPNKDDPDLWFASLVFRLVNWHPTAGVLGYPLPWNPQHFIKVLNSRKRAGEKVFSSAYMISTHGAKESKPEYLARSLTVIYGQREHLRFKTSKRANRVPVDTLQSFHERLMSAYDVGSFLAAQVIADCKYVPSWRRAADWVSFAAPGPGSLRGLNRVCSYPVDDPWSTEDWVLALAQLKGEIDLMVESSRSMPPIHAQDLQNCLCEFDKYERVRLGEGRPRQRYPGV